MFPDDDDLLAPEVPPEPPLDEGDRLDDVTDDDVPGLEGEEHLGLTPPD
jgi:hypothetical protein